MALPPKYAAHRLAYSTPAATSSPIAPAQHTIELFLDYACPYSAKMFATVYDSVLPAIKADPKWASAVNVVFRQLIQPWHPSSTLMHEVALAVALAEPERFWDYSRELFKHQRDYFDVSVVNETRNQTYARLVKLAEGLGIDGPKILAMVTVPDKPNASGDLNIGNDVTNDLKLLVRMARLQGVHVTPTVMFNGVVQPGIESSFSLEQWKEWLTKNIV